MPCPVFSLVLIFVDKYLFASLQIPISVYVVGLKIASLCPLVPAVDNDKRSLHIGVCVNVILGKLEALL